MIHKRPLANYYAAVSAALTAHDVAAVPGLLTLMALDGYGDEAEELRRMMLLVASTTDATPESPVTGTMDPTTGRTTPMTDPVHLPLTPEDRARADAFMQATTDADAIRTALAGPMPFTFVAANAAAAICACVLSITGAWWAAVIPLLVLVIGNLVVSVVRDLRVKEARARVKAMDQERFEGASTRATNEDADLLGTIRHGLA